MTELKKCPRCKGKGHRLYPGRWPGWGYPANLLAYLALSVIERNDAKGFARDTCDFCCGKGVIEKNKGSS